MYNGSPNFSSFRRYGKRINGFAGNIGGVFLIGPGVFLILLGIAIILWPELFAFLFAGLLMMLGATLVLWGWRLNQTQKRIWRQMQQRQNGNGQIYEYDASYQKRSDDSDLNYY